MVAVLLVAIVSVGHSARARESLQSEGIPSGAVRAELVRIVDGDTFDAELTDVDGRRHEERVRMIGIDTPETSYSYGNQPECYGKQATNKTESVLVAAEEIWL